MSRALTTALTSNPVPLLHDLVEQHAQSFVRQIRLTAFNSLVRWTPPSAPGNEVRQTRIRTGAATGNGQLYDIPAKGGVTRAHRALMGRIKIDIAGSGDLPEALYSDRTGGIAAMYWQGKKIKPGTQTPGAATNIPLMVFRRLAAGSRRRPQLLDLAGATRHVLTHTHIQPTSKGIRRARNSKDVPLGWVRKGTWRQLARAMSLRAGSFAGGWTAAGRAIGSKAPDSVLVKATLSHHNNSGSGLLSPDGSFTASNAEVPSPRMGGYASRVLDTRLQREMDYHTRTQQKFFGDSVARDLARKGRKPTPKR